MKSPIWILKYNFVLQDWTVRFWQSQGAHKDKLILGIATYGMSFTLRNPRRNRPGAPAVGGGRRGKYTREKGILSFFEVSVVHTVIWNYDCMCVVYGCDFKSLFSTCICRKRHREHIENYITFVVVFFVLERILIYLNGFAQNFSSDFALSLLPKKYYGP